MTTSLLDDAMAHHIWATQRLIDACTDLTPEQLAIFQRVTWDAVKGYKGAWPAEDAKARPAKP